MTNTDFASGPKRSVLLAALRRLRQSAAPLALLFALMQVAPAYASIDNTVTVTATAPDGSTLSPTGSATVTVVAAAPAITVLKSVSFPAGAGGDVNGNGKADAGDTIHYSYTVTNTGNVSLADVTVGDAHDGVGGALTIVVPTVVTTDSGSAAAGTLGDSTDGSTADAKWDKLGPGDVITFTSSYSVVPGDVTGGGGGDGNLDNTATASGTFTSGGTTTTASATGTATVPLHASMMYARNLLTVPLNVAPNLSVTKVADKTSNLAAGDLVTYTYTVTNTGNVPLTNITLSDTFKGVVGGLVPAFQSFTTDTGSTHTGNTITLLQPGDVAVYTATYTVTQSDVDTLQ
jgi:uncharacterized repeat protein (TIGR01451 family)